MLGVDSEIPPLLALIHLLSNRAYRYLDIPGCLQLGQLSRVHGFWDKDMANWSWSIGMEHGFGGRKAQGTRFCPVSGVWVTTVNHLYV